MNLTNEHIKLTRPALTILTKVSQVQRENLLLAKAMWLKVPKTNVSPELETWRIEPGVGDPHGPQKLQAEPTCKTIACFGGWCAWVPEFMAQGVLTMANGAPTTSRTGYTASFVSDMLFGDASMFFPRAEKEHDDSFDYALDVSDWQVVMNRIDTLLANSVVV